MEGLALRIVAVIFVAALAFLLLREIFCWHWKITPFAASWMH